MSAMDAAVGLFRRSAARRVQRAPVEMSAPRSGKVDSSEEAAIGDDPSDIATSWNAAAERIFGSTAEEVLGQRIPAMTPGRQRENAADPTESEQVAAEWGQRLEKRLEIAERARADAEAANRRKDEFLAILGHELRNPLSAIRNSIVSAQLDPRQCDRALEVAWRQTEQLARLADDILDVSLVEQGRVRLKTACIPLIEIIERAVETTRFLVEDRGHALSVSGPAEPVYVDGDPARLEQIVVNLVSNAAKYTKSGGCIDLSLDGDGAEAVICVRDTGMGISADALLNIFDLFYQAEHTLEHEPGGFGIGLSVVRSLVSLHDGRIEARSDGPGTGSEFTVHLPAVRMPGSEPRTSTRGREDDPAAERLITLLQNYHARELPSA